MLAANSARSVQSSPPVSTEQSAMTNISSRSCRAALPVRGSVRSAKQAAKPAIVFPPPSFDGGVESIRRSSASTNPSMSNNFQMRFPRALAWGLWTHFKRFASTVATGRRMEHVDATYGPFALGVLTPNGTGCRTEMDGGTMGLSPAQRGSASRRSVGGRSFPARATPTRWRQVLRIPRRACRHSLLRRWPASSRSDGSSELREARRWPFLLSPNASSSRYAFWGISGFSIGRRR